MIISVLMLSEKIYPRVASVAWLERLWAAAGVSPSANSGDQGRKKVAQDRENII